MTDIVKVGETGLTEKQVNLLSKTIMKDFKTEEMGLAFHTAKSIGADLFARELRCVKDNKGNLVFVLSRDFLIKKAMENPKFSSLQACSVYSNDEFEIETATGLVKHVVKGIGDRGTLLGAYAIAWSTDGKPYVKIADIKTYKPYLKPDNTYSPWAKNPDAMIIKCAEAQVAKKFAIIGISASVEGDDEIISTRVVQYDCTDLIDKIKKAESIEELDGLKQEITDSQSQQAVKTYTERKYYLNQQANENIG